MPIRKSVCVLLLLLCAAISTGAPHPLQIIPSAAPAGARVIVTGSGLETAEVMFATANGSSAAEIVSRSATLVECIVPADARTGAVTVTTGNAVAALPFTVVDEAPFGAVATIATSLTQPAGIAPLPDGGAFVADTGAHRIVRLDANGAAVSVIGTGKPGFVDGAAASAQFKEPRGLAYDAAAGALYVADSANHAIRRVSASGAVSTIAGDGTPGNSETRLHTPSAVARDASGAIVVADTGNHAIRRVVSNGVIATVAGTGAPGLTDGAADNAQFHSPAGVAVSRDGAIFVADTRNHVLRRIDAHGVTTIAGTGHPGFVDGPAGAAEMHEPGAIAVADGGTLFVADTRNDRIRMVRPSGVTTVAGTGRKGRADGAPLTAELNAPSALAFNGEIWIADSMNGSLRVITPGLSASDLYPRRGPTAGGNTVRIFGTGFVNGATRVRFGTAAATSVEVVAPTELIVGVPAGWVGVVDVTIETRAGSTKLTNAYTYVPPPTIASVSPVKGKTAGGQSVQVFGTDFVDGETSVRFGTGDAGVTGVTPSTILSTTPAQPAGPVAVSVATPGGQATREGAFTYLAPPVISSLAPASAQAGTPVTISGSNFDSDATGNIVRFGPIMATVTSATPTQIMTVVPQGAATAPVTVATAGGDAVSPAPFVVQTYIALAVTPATSQVRIGESRPLTATATNTDGTTRDVTALATWSSSDTAIVTVAEGMVQAIARGTATISASIAGLSASATVQVTSEEVPPPDPTETAPEVSETEPTKLWHSTSFLIDGPSPVQRDVTPGAIEAIRVSVVRGRVLGPDGAALPGVHIDVLRSPQTGYTLSREDGAYDLVVNGGGAITLTYEKDGYLPVQRRLDPEWQHYTHAEDVVMTALDAAVTAIDLASPEISVARGSVVTDADGARQATMLFSPGTQATVTRADGTTQQLSTVHVRATEYSVGAKGPLAMPGDLPSTSGYTYCTELSVDEAPFDANVTFNKPVLVYVDNFLGFPTGMIVPTGYYDRAAAAWKASTNGRVIKILTVVDGVAQVDTDGNGIADAGALDGAAMDDAERRKLGSLYGAGKTLWRVPVTHFTPWDCNWPYTVPPGAVSPEPTAPDAETTADEGCDEPGSIIDCGNQSVGERVRVAGTPLTLNYRSNRVPGRTTNMQVDFTLTKPTVPSVVKAVDLEIEIAGRKFEHTFVPSPNLKFQFKWDGKDAYGRVIHGRQDLKAKVGYRYDGFYVTPGQFPNSFGAISASTQITGVRARQEITLWKEVSSSVGSYQAQSAALGGWTFDGVHTYDSAERALYQGDGSRRASSSTAPALHAAAKGSFPDFLAFSPDGALYYLDGRRIRRKDRNGVVTHIAGTGTTALTGNGGPATAAALGQIEWFAFGPDGSIYFVDTGNYVIRRIHPNGIITHFAGIEDVHDNTGDGGPAANAAIARPKGLAIGPDGAVYFSTEDIIRRIDANGIITTIAGDKFVPPANCNWCTTDTREGVPARTAAMNAQGLSFGPDGSLYVAMDTRIRRIDTAGRIWTVAGRLNTDGGTGDGGPALQATLGWPSVARVGPDGMLYICDRHSHRIRRVDFGGLISTVVGNGCRTYPNGGCGTSLADGVAATNTSLDYPDDIAFSPSGELHIADPYNGMIRRATGAFPGMSLTEQTVASPDGGQVYVFSGSGRHLRTVDPYFKTPLMTYGYDGAGRITSVTDANQRVTTIERDGLGNPNAIVAPNGDRTVLEADGNGFLSRIALPGGVEHRFTYDSGGLLQTYRPPNGSPHTFGYDQDGRLKTDSDPEGGSQSLTATRTATTTSTKFTTGLGRQRTYTSEKLSDGSERHAITDQSGLTSTSTRDVSGNATVTTPDGSQLTVKTGSDTRFGTQALLPTKVEMRTPSGRLLSIVMARSATLAVQSDPMSMTAETSTYSVNGRIFRNFFEAAPRRLTTTTPAGRQIVMSFDAAGRLASTSRGTLAPVSFSYDAKGRLRTIGRDSRSLTYVRDDSDRVTSVTDALSRTTEFSYDTAGRMTRKKFHDGRQLVFGRDGEGNVTAVTPPGRPAHMFTFNSVNLPTSYTAPGSAPMTYAYNTDRQPTKITRADGSEVNFAYDGAQRLNSISAPGGTYTYGYASNGKLASISGPDGGLTFAYDGILPTTETLSGPVSGSVSLTYNNDLFITAENASGSSVDFTYDGDGLLTRAGTMTVTRDPKHRLVTSTMLGSVRSAFTFDGHGGVLTQSAAFGATTLYSETMTRDAGGRILTRTESDSGVTRNYTYSYDGAGRLSGVSANGAQTTYSFDGNGNRLSRTTAGSSTGATYDAQDRLLTYGDKTYTWSANGELATRTSPAGTTTYGYDGRGNLRTVVLPDQTLIEYVIDPLDRRVAKKVNGTITNRYLYAGDRLVAELDVAGAVLTRFVYATRLQVPDYFTRDGKTYRIVADHNGSPRLVVNTADSAVVQQIVYDEFGRVLFDSNPDVQPFRFAGGLSDPQTGLLRFGSRDYDAETGRWTARDPILFSGGGTNLYVYTFGDPVNFVDPNGMLTLPGFGWVDAGEDAGEDALNYYADTLTDPNATWYEQTAAAIGGFFSALWTPCTSDDTFLTLTSAYGASTAVTRYGAATELGGAENAYWRYVGTRSNPNSPWLTRGTSPPYGTNYRAAKDGLQLPNTPTGVQRVDVRWYEPVRGPRTVSGNGQWGEGGGAEYARGWFWPKN